MNAHPQPLRRFQRLQAKAPMYSHWLWLALAIGAALSYLFSLGGDHIPRNGDELVYLNIARLTAETGQWLPLASYYDFMRNTKPPLLFWQAMVAGGWGENWELFWLRLPSVFYSWATAAMVGLLTWKISREAALSNPSASSENHAPNAAHRNYHRYQAIATGALAAIFYLSFFSSYRYGRPYLTSSPETFWLFGIFFVLAWSPALLVAQNAVRWLFVLLAGLALGIGCLYKSFAMVAPVGLGLALCFHCVGAQKMPWQMIRPGWLRDGISTALIMALALGVFGLWFVVDPQPGEVWREFVVGENAGKFKSSPGYWKVAFSSNSSFLTILTAYFSNTGFLLPASVGIAWAALAAWWLRRKNPAAATAITTSSPVSPAEKVMWLWLLALMLVFLLPNQRSARYLIPAMPAVAVLMAIYWPRLGRVWLALTLLVGMVGGAAMALIGYGAVTATGNTGLYPLAFWLYLVFIVLACALGLAKARWSRSLAPLSSMAVLLALAWVTQPFNGALGDFQSTTRSLAQSQRIAVPSNFNGHFERYQFMLPQAKIEPYFAAQPVDFADVQSLFKSGNRYALVQRRPGAAPPCGMASSSNPSAPPAAAAATFCRVLDVRWDIRSRQSEVESTWAAFKTPETFWFAREYFIERLP